MDKFEEATKRQISMAETRLTLVEKENNEPVKILNDSMKIILNMSQQEAKGLKSQLEFLQLVNQNDMSIDKLQEAFEEQISIVEKHSESLQDRKAHIEGAIDNVIKLWSLVLHSMEGENKTLKSHFEFLCSWNQIVTEEMVERIALEDKKSKFQTIADINLTLSEVQKDKEELVTKKERLEEDLKEKNRLEAILLNSKRMLEVEVEPSGSGLDVPVEENTKDKIAPVDDQDLVHDTKIKGSDADSQRGSVQPVVQIIQIDDDSSSSEGSLYTEESEAEVLSGGNITPCDVMQGKGARKQPRQLRTKCNQKQLCNFLSNLIGEKRRVMENSIFRPFLLIPPRSICLSLLQVFIERYNLKNDSFTIGKQALQFCGKEVEKCLGLAYKGSLVDFTTRPKRTPEIFERCLGVKGKITKDELMEKLKHMHVNKGNADDFFRLSVYFMFSVYFFSTNDSYVSYWPVRYLENFENFNSFNWARAIYEYLRESVRKTANEFAEEVTTFISIKGCLPLLETLIYERVGSHYLKVEVDPYKFISHPCIVKYTKGESRNPCTLRRVLGKVKFDKIKYCEDCPNEEAISLERADTSGL